MTTVPIGDDGRRRLRQAQRAESTALSATTRAYAALAGVHRRVEAAEQELDRALGALVDVSGVERAAQLLDQPVAVVRRAQRRARTRQLPGAPAQSAIP